MKRFATVFFALGLATAGSSALAQQGMDQMNKQSPKPQPVKMTDAQMDNVAGGALLIDVYVIDVANNNNVAVAIPAHVNVNAVVALLGAAGGGIVSGQRPGNIDQRR